MMERGSDIYSCAKKIKCSPAKIIDFSSNINLYQPKVSVKNVSTIVSRYSEDTYSELKKAISKRYKVDKTKMALYNGTPSAIFDLLRHLKSDRVYLYAPIYAEYEKSIPKKKEIVKINRFDDIFIEPKEGSIVIFSNPSMPDGKYYNLQKLLKIWKKQNCKIILDESFLEFENLKSYRNEINTNENIYIIQSFTKFYSCAGVRIGAIFSHKKNIKKLQIPRWNLSSFDASFLTNRLKDVQFKTKSQKIHKEQKEYLYQILERSTLFEKVYPSDTNFFLVKSKRAKKIFNYLLKHKVLALSCENFDYLDEDYLSFSVRDQRSLNLLAKAFEVKFKWYEKFKKKILDKFAKLKSLKLKRK